MLGITAKEYIALFNRSGDNKCISNPYLMRQSNFLQQCFGVIDPQLWLILTMAGLNWQM